MEEIRIYRVRKSADDIKSQKGAYFLFECALKKAKKTGCNIYVDGGECVWENPQKFSKFYRFIQNIVVLLRRK